MARASMALRRYRAGGVGQRAEDHRKCSIRKGKRKRSPLRRGGDGRRRARIGLLAGAAHAARPERGRRGVVSRCAIGAGAIVGGVDVGGERRRGRSRGKRVVALPARRRVSRADHRPPPPATRGGRKGALRSRAIPQRHSAGNCRSVIVRAKIREEARVAAVNHFRRCEGSATSRCSAVHCGRARARPLCASITASTRHDQRRQPDAPWLRCGRWPRVHILATTKAAPRQIAVLGSTNPGKLDACQRGTDAWSPNFRFTFIGVNTDSGVSEQPVGLDETLLGARNRALQGRCARSRARRSASASRAASSRSRARSSTCVRVRHLRRHVHVRRTLQQLAAAAARRPRARPARVQRGIRGGDGGAGGRRRRGRALAAERRRPRGRRRCRRR